MWVQRKKMRQRRDIRLVIGAALLAVTSVVSCSKIERTPDAGPHEFSIMPHSEPAVKAVGNEYPENSIFGVFAYNADVSGGTPWTIASPAPVYLKNAAFMYYVANGLLAARGWDVESSATGNHKPYYWPLSGSLMFAGYSPFVQTNESGDAMKDSPIRKVTHSAVNNFNAYFVIDYDVPDDLSVALSTPDLLYFDISSINNGNTVSKQAEAVDVVFSRALAKITFNVSYTEFDKVSVKLTECIDKGTFYSGQRPGWLPDKSTDNSGKLVSIKDYSFTAESVTDNDNRVAGTQYTTSRCIIPQFTNGWFEEMGTKLGDEMEIVLTISDRIGEATSYAEVRFNLSDYVPRLEMGMHYVFNVTVEPKPIQFATPTVSIDLVDVR